MTASRRLVPIIFVILALVTVGMSIVRTNAEQAASMTEAAQSFLETLRKKHSKILLELKLGKLTDAVLDVLNEVAKETSKQYE